MMICIVNDDLDTLKKEAWAALSSDGLLSITARCTDESKQTEEKQFTLSVEAIFREPFAIQVTDVSSGSWHQLQVLDNSVQFEVFS